MQVKIRPRLFWNKVKNSSQTLFLRLAKYLEESSHLINQLAPKLTSLNVSGSKNLTPDALFAFLLARAEGAPTASSHMEGTDEDLENLEELKTLKKLNIRQV